jgi:hypothetical protein
MLSLKRKQNLSLGSRITLIYPRLSHMSLNYLLGTSRNLTLLEAKNKYLVNIRILAMVCLTDFLELKNHKSSSVPPSSHYHQSLFKTKYYQRTLVISNISGHINYIHTIDIFLSRSGLHPIPTQCKLALALITYTNMYTNQSTKKSTPLLASPNCHPSTITTVKHQHHLHFLRPKMHITQKYIHL